MAALTVVLAGKGVSALQEAGIINIAPMASVPRVSILGIFPTLQSIGAQIFMLLAIGAGFAMNRRRGIARSRRSEEHTSELQSLMRISYAVFCLKKKKNIKQWQ